MPAIAVGHIEEPATLSPVFEEITRWHPKCRMGWGMVEGETILESSEGVRYCWIECGEGQIHLPEGYLTQEGDGASLPGSYCPESLPHEISETLLFLREHLAETHGLIRAPAAAILGRLRQGVFVGDIAGEIWLIAESGLEEEKWASSPAVIQAIRVLREQYRSLGWSVKQESSWEALQAGDQLAVIPDVPVSAQGYFRYWWIECLDIRENHTSTARRLRYLKDTAGGCNFAFDAFRRLPLTWCVGTGTPERPDGINRVNSHVVNIAAETSRTHCHPEISVGGGDAQSEMYLVLDPSAYALNTYGRKSCLYTFPDLKDLREYNETHLRPGHIVYIPPGTGHRGVDAFVNVITLPGFKPRNEIYIDKTIKETTGGKSPYNAALA